MEIKQLLPHAITWVTLREMSERNQVQKDMYPVRCL